MYLFFLGCNSEIASRQESELNYKLLFSDETRNVLIFLQRYNINSHFCSQIFLFGFYAWFMFAPFKGPNISKTCITAKVQSCKSEKFPLLMGLPLD